jgi:hypothetical protein
MLVRNDNRRLVVALGVWGALAGLALPAGGLELTGAKAHVVGSEGRSLALDAGVEVAAELRAAVDGSTVPALGRPLAATLTHLDGDGVQDLVVGHAAGDGGALVLYLGNEAYLRSRRQREMWQAMGEPAPLPFATEARVVTVPFAPEQLISGDLDGDGVLDVAVTALGRSDILLLPGDGSGGLRPPRTVALPGPVTAIAAGEVNRHDALADVVVGVVAPEGPRLLVYQWPEGAFNGEPESLAMPAAVTAVAVGELDGGFGTDLAVAAGSHLLVVAGRDRKLTLPDDVRLAVPAPSLESLPLDRPAQTVLVGDFVGDRREEVVVADDAGDVLLVSGSSADGRWTSEGVASVSPGTRLVASRAAARPHQDLLLVEPSGRELRVMAVDEQRQDEKRLEGPRIRLMGEATAVLTASLDGDATEDLLLLVDGASGPVVMGTRQSRAVYTVTTSGDGAGSCNANNECTTLRAAINAANANPLASEIVFGLGVSDRTIRPTSPLPSITVGSLAIDGMVGTPPVTFRVILDGGLCGASCDGLMVRGGHATVESLNIHGFSRYGVWMRTAGSDVLTNSWVGIDAAGAADGNQIGVLIDAISDCTVGGTSASQANVLSGNTMDGIQIYGSVTYPATNNTVYGNYIGTNATGTAAVGNTRDGVCVRGVSGNWVGSALPGARNVIGGNGDAGVGLYFTATADETGSNVVLGNHIGVGADGLTALPNHDGVYVNLDNSTVGGSTAAARNVIAGNYFDGVVVHQTSVGVQVQGNYIGFASDGATLRRNGTHGVVLEGSSYATVGGSTAGTGNSIAYFSYGVYLVDLPLADQPNHVIGNLIGTNAGGAAAGGLSGVHVASSYGARVGTPASGNVIADGDTAGVEVQGGGDHLIEGNVIGLAPDETTPLPNGYGILINDSTDCTTGKNTIAHNTQAGIQIAGASALGNTVTFSWIHDNGYLGIDLGQWGVTPNDADDSDTGANGLQNFPLITAANVDTGEVTVTLTSRPSRTYTIGLYANTSCDPSGHGEGEIYLGGFSLTTNSSGVGAAVGAEDPFTAGQYLTVTATDNEGNTSEFSPCFLVGGDDEIFSDGFESGNTSAWS